MHRRMGAIEEAVRQLLHANSATHARIALFERRVETLETENRELRAENVELRGRLDSVEAQQARLAVVLERQARARLGSMVDDETLEHEVPS